jgi:hypothetical protein
LKGKFKVCWLVQEEEVQVLMKQVQLVQHFEAAVFFELGQHY